MATYTISKSFRTHVERTPRVLEVAEAFGLGLSDKMFTVYDGLEIEIQPGDVVYITGQSGSGKSLLLRDLSAAMEKEGLKVKDINSVDLPELPVIEIIGKSTVEALDLLAKAGISDAWIFLRKPSELSDGQRYRLRLAKLLESDADVWVADEFGAILDRVTAKAVAMNMSKIARKFGKTFMVATTHSDMVEELAPSVQITKMFKERVQVETAR